MAKRKLNSDLPVTPAKPAEPTDLKLMYQTLWGPLPQPQMAPKWDWALMPDDNLLKILQKLPSPVDFLNFALACRAWKEVTIKFPEAPSYPFLVELSVTYPSHSLIVHSPFSTDRAAIVLPEMADKRLAGNSRGYLIVVDKSDLKFSLINPVSQHQIPLPQMRNVPDAFQPYLIYKDDQLVIFSHLLQYNLVLGFCKLGNACTTISRRVGPGGGCTCFYQGNIFLNESSKGPTLVISPKSYEVERRIPAPKDRIITSRGTDYLLASPIGLLRVFRPCDTLQESKFEVHVLSMSAGEALWVKLKTVGSLMLFLDRHCGFCLSCLNGVAGMREDAIYFTKMKTHGSHSWSSILCRYDIRSGKTEIMSNKLRSRCSWLIPG